MPIYEYKCSKCGHSFESMQKMSDPNPPCPAPAGLPGTSHPNGVWADFWAEAKKNFEAGKKTPYPAAPTWMDVGPEYEHNVIHVEGVDSSKWKSTKKTLADWLSESPGPCGGETAKQISRSSFHLKGSGWYATDYKR